MNTPHTRREFLSAVGQGMLVASVGAGLASELNLGVAYGDETGGALSFGALEPLVCLMQETPADRLLPALVERLQPGHRAAAAGGRGGAGQRPHLRRRGLHRLPHHDGARRRPTTWRRSCPTERQPLPVFKVLYRNTNRIQEHGGRKSEVLHPVEPATLPDGTQRRRGAARRRAQQGRRRRRADLRGAGASDRRDDAFNELLLAVQDDTEVHRVVLPYRAWDLLGSSAGSRRTRCCASRCAIA